MVKRIVIAVFILVIVVGALVGIKALQIGAMVEAGKQAAPPPEAVSTSTVQSDEWETVLTSVGSLSAVQGVMVTAEVPGKIVDIFFQAGSLVKAGDVLVQQDISTETAQLRATQTQADLARVNLERAEKLLPENVISQSRYDDAKAAYQEAMAQLDNIRTVIAKKTIRAPFGGRLGIRLVNLGQFVEAGTEIVTLQSMSPIFVNFTLPQQQLGKIKTGFPVRITLDSDEQQVVGGRITAINPQVDPTTRNIRVQATVTNDDELLRPGMFVNVAVVLPERQRVLVIPATAVQHAPYSDSVFLVEKTNGANGQPGLVARQQFIKTGEKRGDFVAVQSGLQDGQTVVSAGAFKLRNGQPVIVNNDIKPEYKLAPKPEEA